MTVRTYLFSNCRYGGKAALDDIIKQTMAEKYDIEVKLPAVTPDAEKLMDTAGRVHRAPIYPPAANQIAGAAPPSSLLSFRKQIRYPYPTEDYRC